LGEGFDDARLDTLFLAMPISWKGTLQQYVGRLHRLHDGKHVVQVYDYIDPNVVMLARMYDRRLRGYDTIGYSVEEPFDRVFARPNRLMLRSRLTLTIASDAVRMRLVP